MKKIIVILSMLLIGSISFLQAQAPVAGKKYYIKNSELGLYLTIDPSQNLNVTKVDNYTGSENQIFELVRDASSPEHFNLKVLNKYLTKSSLRRYELPWPFELCDVLLDEDSTTDDAEFILLTTPTGYTAIQSFVFANTKKYLAPGFENPIYDSRAEIKPGATCYIDAHDFYPGADNRYAYFWTFEEIGKPEETMSIKTMNPDNQSVDVFEKADIWISFTKPLPSTIDLSGVTMKGSNGNVVSGVSVAVSASRSTIAIAHKELAYGETYTVTIPAGAIAGYESAIQWSFTVRDLPDWQQDKSVFLPGKGISTGKKYKIRNVTTGDYLTIHPELESNVARVQNYMGSENQIFELFQDASNPENFNIGIAGKYLTLKSGIYWAIPVILGNNPAVEEAEFVLNTNNKGLTTIQSKFFTCDQRYFMLDAEQTLGAYPYGGICYADQAIQFWKLEELEAANELKTNTFTPLKDEMMISTGAEVAVSFTKPLPENTNLSGITIKDKEGNQLSGIQGTVSASRWSITIAHDDFKRGKTYTVSIPANSIPGYTHAIEWSFSTNEPVAYPSKGKYYIKNVGANAYLTVNVLPDFADPVGVKAKDAKGTNESNVFDILEGENGKILLRIADTEQFVAFVHTAVWGRSCGINENTISRTQFYQEEGSTKGSVHLRNVYISSYAPNNANYLTVEGDVVYSNATFESANIDWILEQAYQVIYTNNLDNETHTFYTNGPLPKIEKEGYTSQWYTEAGGETISEVSKNSSLYLLFTDAAAPTAPTNLTGVPTETTIALSWTASTDNVGVTGYNVYVAGKLAKKVTETTYTVTGLAAGTKYLIEAEAEDAAGNKSPKASITQTTLRVTGIDFVNGGNWSVYPNPFSDYVIVNTATEDNVVIYDASGNAILSVTVKAGNNRIDTSALTNGVYILKQGSNVAKIAK